MTTDKEMREAFARDYSVGDSTIDAISLAVREDGEYVQALARVCFKWYSAAYQLQQKRVEELESRLTQINWQATIDNNPIIVALTKDKS